MPKDRVFVGAGITRRNYRRFASLSNESYGTFACFNFRAQSNRSFVNWSLKKVVSNSSPDFPKSCQCLSTCVNAAITTKLLNAALFSS